MRFCADVLLSIFPTWAFAYSDTSMVDDRASATAYIESHQNTAMKDGFLVRLGPCDSDMCIIGKTTTLIAMKGAYKKDYGDQRNLAFCLSTGCDEAIIQNVVAGCAWRIVILASSSAELDDSDQANFKLECGRLTGVQLATAKAQAATLYNTVYKRQIPRDFQ
jgi:hypothetical protein